MSELYHFNTVTTKPTTSIYTTTSQLGYYSSQDGMGAVKAAVVVWSLEWLSVLIPIFLLFVISICCYKKRVKNNSSQTDNATVMTELRPEPVGEAQSQVGVEVQVQTKSDNPKDFILVVSEV